MSKSPKSTYRKGREAEEMAVAWLESKGWTILDRNYSFMRAEVDVVAYDQKCIVFVEVRSLADTKFGYPEETIGREKEKQIYKAAEAWMYERKMEGSPARFDVVSIVQKENEAPSIQHFENAFQ